MSVALHSQPFQKGGRLPTALPEAGRMLGEDPGSRSGSQTSAGIGTTWETRHWASLQSSGPVGLQWG